MSFVGENRSQRLRLELIDQSCGDDDRRLGESGTEGEGLWLMGLYDFTGGFETLGDWRPGQPGIERDTGSYTVTAMPSRSGGCSSWLSYQSHAGS